MQTGLLSGLLLLAGTGWAADAPVVAARTVAQLKALQPADFQAAMTSRDGEQSLRAAELASLQQTARLPAGPQQAQRLPGALWTAQLFNVDPALLRRPLLKALATLDHQSPGYQLSILTAAYTRYAKEAVPQLRQLLPRLGTAKEFAVAAYALLKADDSARSRRWLADQMAARFPAWRDEPRLMSLDHALHTDLLAELRQRPPLADLLAAPLRPGLPVVFSFQRHDRQHIGLAMVRGADGRFIRNPDGSYFNVPQLALAGTQLPGTITNGNTPQGIFTIKGTGTAQDNIWMGPTPYLSSFLPVEAPLSDFEHAPTASAWNEAAYDSFLPPTWRNYFPIKETWRAGLAGRNEILAHGTTINTAYYRDASYYPGTPSAGCLVALEYWSKRDGSLMHSDQLALVKAFVAGGKDEGYLVVVNIDDAKRPVLLADVIDEIVAAEAR